MAKLKVIYKPKGAAAEYSHLAINLYIGCRFACKYCYAPAIARQTLSEWSANPQPRKDILKKIEADAKQIEGDERTILLCYTSDPYQSPEAAALTREALLILEKYNLTATVLTKAGRAAEQDFDILRRNKWEFGTTLSGWLETSMREWEPFAASNGSRNMAIATAHNTGIKTWVSMEPVYNTKDALMAIEYMGGYVDFWKIGKMNHRTLDIDWAKFRTDAIELLEKLGAKYYIKKELRGYTGAEKRLDRSAGVI